MHTQKISLKNIKFYDFCKKNKNPQFSPMLYFNHLPYPPRIFLQPKIQSICIKLDGEYEFEKKNKKKKLSIFDREDFTDNDT